jgi:hypothetical protein
MSTVFAINFMFTLFYTINLNTFARLQDGRRDRILLRCTCHPDTDEWQPVGGHGLTRRPHVFWDHPLSTIGAIPHACGSSPWPSSGGSRCRGSYWAQPCTSWQAAAGSVDGHEEGRPREASQGKTGIAKSKSTRDRNETCGGCGT